MESLHPRNLNEVFTYNHMVLMSLRSCFYVKASMVLTISDNLFIYNYIRSLLNNNLIVPTSLKHISYILYV